MKIIVCLDDFGGMTFNHRRQSRDRVVVADIISMLDGSPLYIDEYSAPLFAGSEVDVRVVEDIVNDVPRGEYCFVENRAVSLFSGIEEVVIYRWNRVYPRDLCFDISLDADGFKLSSAVDFEGYSHEKISKEIFAK